MQQPCLALRIITIGYFVTLCEGCVVVAVAIAERLM